MRFFRIVIRLLVICGIALHAGCEKRHSAPPLSDRVRERAILKWQGRVVRRPGPTPEDGKVYLVEGGQKRWIISGDWLALHGYNILDPQVVPSEELAAIPTGEDIQ